jgi:RIO-like serine/threonine protein kinase
MSKTDKTKPCYVRLREVGAEEFEYTYKGRSTFSVPRDFKWSYVERGVGPKEVRWAKRMKSKKNRCRKIPWTQMRGHGYGSENLLSPTR